MGMTKRTKDRLILTLFAINILVCILCGPGCSTVPKEDPCFWDYDDKPECWDREPVPLEEDDEDPEEAHPTTCEECVTDSECEALCPDPEAQDHGGADR